MRAFVTGGHGFVGTWLRAHLEESGDDVVAPVDVDVTDPTALREAVAAARPEAVYHLAGLAHVGQSWERAGEYFRVNGGGTLEVLEAARRCTPVPRVLVVSSAEVYGRVAPEQMPLREDAHLRPVSPYAASKAAAEMVAVQAFEGGRVPVVVARPFNHAGPGQSPTFVVPALATRILDGRRDGIGVLTVGNLSTRRDLTDVRDIVRAYRSLVLCGEPGQAYNVCSGQDVAIEEVVHRLLVIAGSGLEVQVDPELLRPADVPVLRGDPAKLKAATGWEPVVALDETLADVLASLGGAPV